MDIPVASVADWLITFGAVTIALGAAWKMWGRPVQQWIMTRVDTAEARLVGIENQLKISNGRATAIEGHVVATDAALAAHIIEATPMLRAFNMEHPPAATPAEPAVDSLPPPPTQEKE